MALSGRRRQGNPDRFSSRTLNTVVMQMGNLLPFHIFDACWNRVADDFGVFPYNAHEVAGEAIGLLLEAGMFTIAQVEESLDRLTQAGEFLVWTERRGGVAMRWAVLPNWGDEQYIPSPSATRYPPPPPRILGKCSLKTREHFARYHPARGSPITQSLRTDSVEITQSLRNRSARTTESLRSRARTRGGLLPPEVEDKQSSPGGTEEGREGGAGGGAELAAVPEEFRGCLDLLYAVAGYPADVAADVALLERAQRCFPQVHLEDVVGAWVTRRGDEPLLPNARPRQQLWNWFRMEAKWDEERRQRRGQQSADDGRGRSSNNPRRGEGKAAAEKWARKRAERSSPAVQPLRGR